jgi:Fe-S oxidoreductase
MQYFFKEEMMGLERYRGDVGMCCRCSACKFVPMQMVNGFQYVNICPSISKYGFHAYSGGGRLNIAAAKLNDSLTYTDKLRHIVYNCQMCGACGVSCNYAMDMEVQQPIQEFRIETVSNGQVFASLEKVVEGLRQTNSMVPVSGKRMDWASGLDLKNVLLEKVDVLYHVGCLTSYDKNMQKLARSTARILQYAGVNFGIAGEAEMCCGGRAYQMGYEADFLAQARKNMSLIHKAGVKTLITGCADCYQAFKVLYDKFNMKGDLEVLHITEYIDKLIKEGRLKLTQRVNLNVTYHDPCRLGRLGEPWIHWEGKKAPGSKFVFDPPKEYRRGTKGIYEPPREVLQSIPGIKVSEMSRIKEYAWCCGAGGGVLDSNPEFALWTANERIDEAKNSGADVLVTACPWCEKIFNEAAQRSDSNFKVYDVVELVEKAL